MNYDGQDIRMKDLCQSVITAVEPDFTKLAPSGARLRAKPIVMKSAHDVRILVCATAPVPDDDFQVRAFCAAVQIYQGESPRIVVSRTRYIVQRLAKNLSDICQPIAG